MKTYAGLDVSQQETQICVISDDGEVLFEGKCPTDPNQIANLRKKPGPRDLFHLCPSILPTMFTHQLTNKIR